MTDNPYVRAYLNPDSAQIVLRADHMSAHRDTSESFTVTMFIPLGDVDDLIAALQKVSDKETARHYADSELQGNPKEET